MRIIRPSTVVFAEDKVEKKFNELEDDSDLKNNLIRAVNDLKINAFCGIQIPKRLFPKEYIIKYQIKNLWKYDLPDGWRVIYTITTPSKVEILSVILEFFDHREYGRRFNYQ